ncbi:WXG100 family type VII secretion target [Umezawaea beigongshangensis]|uniref:WXG100 family type VII secretion target n=1 Tax=Umezawaea beigongshangensis TaxID=2780383 RepID=UPI0027DE353A|nr:hypothetical protein [Umezawaea beigongshangensis]
MFAEPRGRVRGRSGRQIAADVADQLDRLSALSRRVGVADPVQDFFRPLLGEWDDLHEEAERWRRAVRITTGAAELADGSLGELDAAWRGRDADAFVEHLSATGRAGGDVSDAMGAMADALDLTADALRRIVADLAELLADAADALPVPSLVPPEGERAVVEHLEELRQPVSAMHDAAREVLEAFLGLCEALVEQEDPAGDRTSHRPERAWAPAEAVPAPEAATTPAPAPAPAVSPEPEPEPEPAKSPAPPSAAVPSAAASTGAAPAGAVPTGAVPAAPPQPPATPQFGGATAVQEPSAQVQPGQDPHAAPARAATATAGAGVGAGMGMMPPMMAQGGQGEDKEHKPKQRLDSSAEALFGKPRKTTPPVIGED